MHGVGLKEVEWNIKIHGWSMTGAWVIFAFIMIVTNRYLRGVLWRSAIWIHAISGLLVYLVMLASALYTLILFKWYFEWNTHLRLATPLITLTIFIVLSGLIQRYISYASRWNTKTILRLRFTHRLFGFLFIVLGQCTVYSKAFPEMKKILFVLLGLLVLLEIIYQLRQMREIPLNGNNSTYKLTHA